MESFLAVYGYRLRFMQDQHANNKDQRVILCELNIYVLFFLTGWFANIRKTSGTAIFIIRQYGRGRTDEFLNSGPTPDPSLPCGDWRAENQNAPGGGRIHSITSQRMREGA
jgi:hypothetical protein